MSRDNAYTKNYFFADKMIYVHKKNYHIGYANNGSFLGPNQLYSIYNSQKENAKKATEFQYINLLKESIHITEDSKEIIDTLLKQKPQYFVESIDTQLWKSLNDSLDRNKAYEMMGLYKKTSKIANQLFDKNAEKSLQGFNELLEILSRAAYLLEGSGAEIAEALLIAEGGKGGKKSFGKMGRALQKAVSKYVGELKDGQLIDVQRARAAANGINALGELLITKKTAKNKPLTEASFRKALQTLFNTNFAESVATFINNGTQSTLDNTVISLIGDRKTEIQLTDETGHVVQKENNNAEKGKADIKYENVEVALVTDWDSGVAHGSINIDVGISNKFYMSQDFPSKTGKMENFSFKGGESGRLDDVVYSLFGNSYNRYLAYNTLFHHNRAYPDYQILTKLMAVRNITRGLASRGGKEDFAQFIYVNGEVISLWEVIQKSFENINNDPVVNISIEGDLGKEYQNIVNNNKRIPLINKSFSEAKTEMELHAKKILNAIK